MTPIPALNSPVLPSPGSSGFQITITDPAMQAYLQRNPFSAGPDPQMNDLGLKRVSCAVHRRTEGLRVLPILLALDQTRLSAEEAIRVNLLLDVIVISPARKIVHMDDFAWEINLVPRTALDVLIIGCGNGLELLFLRSVLPHATFTAIDYYKKLLPGLEKAVGMTFIEGDIATVLPTHSRRFDLVFSNHTMEHLYAPNDMLTTLAGLLVNGGHIVSVMPMVGLEGTPFLEKVRSFAAQSLDDGSVSIHPLELIYFDPGHPWKTNPDDLSATLSASGFCDILIYQRENHRSRPLQLTPAQYRRKRSRMVFLNRLFIGLPRRLIVRLFPRLVPRKLVSLFFAAERRTPFGTNYIMNIFSEEALFLARVDRRPHRMIEPFCEGNGSRRLF